MSNDVVSKDKKKPSFLLAFGTVVAMITFIMIGMIKFDASITTMFLLSWLIVVPVAMKLGYSNNEIEDGAYE